MATVTRGRPVQVQPDHFGALPALTKTDYCDLLPSAPYCVDQLGRPLLIRKAAKAIELPNIQPNWPTEKRWMTFDLDDRFSWFLPDERGLPPPTYLAVNRQNGHAHAGYLLIEPVSFYDGGRERPLQFFRDVERGFCRRLGADRGYSGFLTKNPVHSRWETDWQAKLPYRLDELNDSLDRGDKRRTPRVESESAIGRNVSVFDAVRRVAYREVMRFKREGKTQEVFEKMLLGVADAVNQEFPLALYRQELAGIVRSIGKWTWGRFTFERFSAIQASRGVKAWSKTPTRGRGKPWLSEGVSRATYYRRTKLLPS